VIISFCAGASSVVVRGWDRNEVRARIESGESIELKGSQPDDKPTPAARLEILTGPAGLRGPGRGACQSVGDVELDVPRGANLELRTNNGDVDVENVARVRVQSMSGSLSFRGLTKAIEASTFSGDITVEKARGPLNVTSISGSVDVRDAQPIDTWDSLEAVSTSGEVNLSNSLHAQVRAHSVSGDLFWNGPLAANGKFDLSNVNGDITFVLPASSSFLVIAKVAAQGSIVTDFALRSDGDPSLREQTQRVRGIYGTGSSQLIISSFNGTIRLRKK
jgi:DUF4097 and DUF4098 domain-containing protein YvlB